MNELFGTLQGTPYGATAKEIEAQLQRAQENVYAKKIADMKNQMLQNAGLSNQGVYAAAISGHNSFLGQQASNIFAARPQVLHPDPHTIPEMQMSLEVAYNMWLVRFGDMWVKSEDVQDADGFRWPLVASRLRDMRLMEVTTVSNHYRLVPHVWT